MANHLDHIEEFCTLLKDYKIDTANPALNQVELVLMIGPTAVGRDTVTHYLEKTGRYRHLVSTTTREPRVNNGIPEKNGVEYWFVDEATMLEKLKNHQMLEAEIIHGQQVSGISLAELETAHREGKIAITNVELNIKNIIAAKSNAVPILVLPPSFEAWVERVRGRGESNIEELKRRGEGALKIFEAALEWDIFNVVINDKVENAAQQIEEIVAGGSRQTLKLEHRALITDLIDKTKARLAS